MQRDFLPVHILHVVVQARMVGDLSIVAQGDILLLPVPVHHLVRLLEEVALPQWDTATAAHLCQRSSVRDQTYKHNISFGTTGLNRIINRFTLNANGNECLPSLWSRGLNNLVDFWISDLPRGRVGVLTELLCLNIMQVSCLPCRCCLLLSCSAYCCCCLLSCLKFCCCCNSLTSSRTLFHPFTITKSVFSGFTQSKREKKMYIA